MKRCGVYEDRDGRWYAYVNSPTGTRRAAAWSERQAREALSRLLAEQKARKGVAHP